MPCSASSKKRCVSGQVARADRAASPRSAGRVCAAMWPASAIASLAVSTPARLRPVSHSMTTPSGRPAISAACGRPSITAGLSAADRDRRPPDEAAEAADLLLSEQVVADQDVVEPAIDHHLGLADLLAGDALRAGLALHVREPGLLCVLMCGRLATPARRTGLHAGDVASTRRDRSPLPGPELASDLRLKCLAAHRWLPRGSARTIEPRGPRVQSSPGSSWSRDEAP